MRGFRNNLNVKRWLIRYRTQNLRTVKWRRKSRIIFVDDSEAVYLCWWLRSSLEACNFTKKKTLAQVFSCELSEIFKNTLFSRTPPVAISDDTLSHILANRNETLWSERILCFIEIKSNCRRFKNTSEAISNCLNLVSDFANLFCKYQGKKWSLKQMEVTQTVENEPK